jgi:serine/threonine protein kinase
MNPERLNQIEEIYHAALERPGAERDAFLGENCGDDNDLRREVESLLSIESSSDVFIDSSPASLAADMFSSEEKAANLVGKVVGHYDLVKLIGTGGMGEVYLAEDSMLRRKIALKILPSRFENDPERKKRFEKEARAVSALNHPNIITIYEIGTAENFSFMATEYVDGQTLRKRIAERTFPWQEAVKIGIQIAGAMESAHSVGIIHRDIKPANIMIRRDGIVKVLDFGLAKLTAPDATDLETREHTAPHRVMGTLNYMSPEQAMGEVIDERTDIFSFGVVLYEMLTGVSPFTGASDSGVTNAAIPKALPPISETNPDIPSTLDQIVRRALKKDRDDRYQSFSHLRNDLKGLLRDAHTQSFDYSFDNKTLIQTDPGKDTRSSRSTNATTTARRWSPAWMIAPVLLVGLVIAAYWQFLYAASGGINPFQSTKLDILTAHGLAIAVAISPDGRYIAYAKTEEDGRQSVWLRQTASVGDTQISPPGQTKYDFLKFSPDGNSLFSIATEGEGQPPSLFQMTTLGLNRRKMVADVNSQITFSPDGASIAFIRVTKADNSIIIVDNQGANERILRTRKFPEVFGDEISWSPDGRLIAAPTLTRGATYAGGMAVIDVAAGTETRIPLKEVNLLRISQLAWVNDGKGLIYMPYAAGMGQRYQIRYAAYPSGEIQNVTNDLTSYDDFSMTADSQTIVAVQREYSMGIWLTAENDFSTAVGINSKTAPDDGERGVTWTKGGKVVFVSSEGGAQNIWRMNPDGSDPKPLTTDYKVGKAYPSLSMAGDAITYFYRDSDPVTKEPLPGNTFFQMDSDGQNSRRVIAHHDVASATASANAEWVVYTSRADGVFRIWKAPVTGGEPVRLTDVDSIWPALSRDGRTIAYFINEKGAPLRIGISSIDGGPPLKTIELPATTTIDAGLAWNKAGNGILFVNTMGTTSNIWTQPLDGSKPTQLTAFKEFQIASFALNAEGTRLAVARGSRNRNIVLIKTAGK